MGRARRPQSHRRGFARLAESTRHRRMLKGRSVWPKPPSARLSLDDGRACRSCRRCAGAIISGPLHADPAQDHVSRRCEHGDRGAARPARRRAAADAARASARDRPANRDRAARRSTAALRCGHRRHGERDGTLRAAQSHPAFSSRGDRCYLDRAAAERTVRGARGLGAGRARGARDQGPRPRAGALTVPEFGKPGDLVGRGLWKALYDRLRRVPLCRECTAAERDAAALAIVNVTYKIRIDDPYSGCVKTSENLITELTISVAGARMASDIAPSRSIWGSHTWMTGWT